MGSGVPIEVEWLKLPTGHSESGGAEQLRTFRIEPLSDTTRTGRALDVPYLTYCAALPFARPHPTSPQLTTSTIARFPWYSTGSPSDPIPFPRNCHSHWRIVHPKGWIPSKSRHGAIRNPPPSPRPNSSPPKVKSLHRRSPRPSQMHPARHPHLALHARDLSADSFPPNLPASKPSTIPSVLWVPSALPPPQTMAPKPVRTLRPSRRRRSRW